MKEMIKKLEEEKKRLEILVDKLNTIIYDLKDYEDLIEDSKEEITLINSKKGIEQRDQAKDKMMKKAEEEKLKNSVQRIKPIKIDLKKKRGKYPKEMEGFVERHLDSNSNQRICDLVSEKFGFEITTPQLSNYMHMRNLKRDNPNRQREERKKEKKMGPPKIWTDEIVKFLKENIDNFSRKELCEKLKKFKIDTNTDNLSAILNRYEIKRTHKEVDPKIVDFVNKRKTDDILILKDEIIEKFGTNILTVELKKLMNNKKIKLKGEGVGDEVKRIKDLREPFEDDEDIDGMELD